jgi:diguanylate cyclase (GGDEF)-like protein/PAS domain S-box-containing protein
VKPPPREPPALRDLARPRDTAAWLVVAPPGTDLGAALNDGSGPPPIVRAYGPGAVLDGLLRSRDWSAVVVAGGEGPAVLAQVRREAPGLPTVVVCERVDVPTVARWRERGAVEVVDGREPGGLRDRVAEALERPPIAPFVPPDPVDAEDGGRFVAALARFHADVARADDLGAGLTALLDAVARTTDVLGLEVWRLTDDGGGLALEARHGVSARSTLDGAPDADGIGLVRAVFERGRPLTVRDLDQSDAAEPFAGPGPRPRLLRADAARALGVRAVHAEPVRVDGTVRAVLVALLAAPEAIDGTVARLGWWLARAHEALTPWLHGRAGHLEHGRLREAIDEAQLGLVTCDDTGRLTLVSKMMTRAGFVGEVGDPPERWRLAWNLTTADEEPLVLGADPLSRALRGERILAGRVRSRSTTGRTRRWRVDAAPLFGPDGQPHGARATFLRDDTTRDDEPEPIAATSDVVLRDFRLLLDRAGELAAAVAEGHELASIWPALDAFVAATTPARRWYLERGAREDVRSGAATDADLLAHGGVDPQPPRPGDEELPPDRRVVATLRTGPRVLGRLTLIADEPGALDERHATAAAMAANLVAVAVDHADLVVQERRLRRVAEASATHFRRMFDATPLAVALATLDDAVVLDVNPAFAALVGQRAELLLGRPLGEALGTASSDLAADLRARVAAGIPVKTEEVELARSDGRPLHGLVSAERTEHEGRPALLLTIVDVTDRLAQEARMRQLATFREKLMGFIEQTLDEGFEGAIFFQRLVESAVAATPGAEAGSLLLRDDEGDRYRFAAAVGYDLERLAPVTFGDDEIHVSEHATHPVVVHDYVEALGDDERGRLLRRHGRTEDIRATLTVPIVLSGRRVAALCLDSFTSPDAFGEEAHRLAEAFGAQVATLVRRRSLELALERMAYHDHLTGLPNRVLFRDRLVQAVARARRNGRKGAALFLDLDNLKVTNDTLGHAVGDALLRGVAQRLQKTVREEDTVARIGGDEFTIVLPEIPDASAAARVAEKLLDAFRTPFQVAGHEIHTSASIGITIFPDDAIGADALIQHGDTAMYHAKNHGKDRYRFFTRDMNRDLLERASLEAQLRKALERDEFVLHYQPRVALADGRVTSVEALARWPHPERGWVPPSAFIPVAEESGLIGAIGRRLLTLACTQGRRWVDAGTPTVVAFNLSARQLQERDLVAHIEGVLADTGLAPEYLEVELTESAVMRNVEENVKTLTAMRALGIRISIDDFGTAYSSLNYLKRLPATALKVDQSFVADLGDPLGSPHDAGIVRAIVALARTLDLTAIAEGIETPAQLAFLRKVGCDQGQGYLFGRPAPASEIDAVLQAGVVPMPPPDTGAEGAG